MHFGPQTNLTEKCLTLLYTDFTLTVRKRFPDSRRSARGLGQLPSLVCAASWVSYGASQP
jgi:hypothetical protein